MKTPKYEFIHTKSKHGREKTICITHFAGKTVRGTCVCSDNDTYDREYGERLAKARCNARVEDQRFNLRWTAYVQALAEFQAAEEKLDTMYDRLLLAEGFSDKAEDELAAITAERT